MTSYHFDVGNSNDGPIGFCARVLADSREEAVERLRLALDNMQDNYKNFDDCTDDKSESPGEGIEYVKVYFNADAITAANIDDEEERDENGELRDDEDDEEDDEELSDVPEIEMT